MPAEITRVEFEARVGTLEGEVEGEKMVTRHILEQTRHNGDDLAALKTRLDRIEPKVDRLDHMVNGVEHKVDGLGGKVDRLEHKLDALSQSLPRIVGDAVRELMRDDPDRS